MSIFKFSWFFAMAIGLIFSTIYKRANHEKLMKKGIAKEDVDKAYIAITAGMVITAGLIGLNQLISGIENPFYLYSQNLSNTSVLIGKCILSGFWAVLILWCWFSQQFTVYVRLILPEPLKKLEFMAKPFMSLVALVGVVLLFIYPGNQLPIIITNTSDQQIEWVEISNSEKKYRTGPIASKKQKVQRLVLKEDTMYVVKYKLEGNPKTLGAKVPFEIGEFSMGAVQVLFDRAGGLRVLDRRLFK